MGISVEGHRGVRRGLLNGESDRMQPSRGELTTGINMRPLCPYGSKSRFFEVYNRGTQEVDWYATVK
jgi:hypothetical protein